MATEKLVPYIFFQCPHCGHLDSSLSGRKIDNEVKFQCFDCLKYAKREEWKEIEKKVWAYRCETCGRYIENVSTNWNLCGAFRKELLCPVCLHQRNGLVAIDGHHISEIRTVRPDMLKRSWQITDDIYALNVKTKWDQMALRYMNAMAMREEQSFRVMPRRTLKSYILLSKEGFIGYLAWTEGKLPTMRQLFVVKEERRKGHATQLVQHFVREQCPKPNDEGILFNIESPNDASIQLFAKLGYIEIKENHFLGLKVRFVRGL